MSLPSVHLILPKRRAPSAALGGHHPGERDSASNVSDPSCWWRVKSIPAEAIPTGEAISLTLAPDNMVMQYFPMSEVREGWISPFQ
jgi:hypothetical protein